MSAIVIQTLFRCVSETSIDWCGLEGVHCDVVIAQTNDTWGHIAGHATRIHLLLIVAEHNVEVSNRFTAKRQLREYESIEIIQIDNLSECICVSSVNSIQSSRPLRL
jgi:hypothetical protein